MPVRTWPVPILFRRGGAPRPNGPAPSSSVGGQPGAAGAEATPPAARAARARAAAHASSLTLPGLPDGRSGRLGDGGFARARLVDA